MIGFHSPDEEIYYWTHSPLLDKIEILADEIDLYNEQIDRVLTGTAPISSYLNKQTRDYLYGLNRATSSVSLLLTVLTTTSLYV